jgi:hypothetical protein
MELLYSLQIWGVGIFIGWIAFTLIRSRSMANRYWQIAATELSLNYEYHLGMAHSRTWHTRFEPLKQTFPLMVNELSPFLRVLNDPAHIFAPVRLLAGVYRGADILLMELRGGFKWRRSLIAPAQTSNFYFIGHAQLSSTQPVLLVAPTKTKVGEKSLRPMSDLKVAPSLGAYTAYSTSRSDPFITRLLSLLNNYGADERLYVLITGQSLYIYSTYRPDLVRWAKLLYDISHVSTQGRSPQRL